MSEDTVPVYITARSPPMTLRDRGRNDKSNVAVLAGARSKAHARVECRGQEDAYCTCPLVCNTENYFKDDGPCIERDRNLGDDILDHAHGRQPSAAVSVESLLQVFCRLVNRIRATRDHTGVH